MFFWIFSIFFLNLVQILCILEEIESFYWPKMHLWKDAKKFGQGPAPPSFGQNPKEEQLFFGKPSLIYWFQPLAVSACRPKKRFCPKFYLQNSKLQEVTPIIYKLDHLLITRVMDCFEKESYSRFHVIFSVVVLPWLPQKSLWPEFYFLRNLGILPQMNRSLDDFKEGMSCFKKFFLLI